MFKHYEANSSFPMVPRVQQEVLRFGRFQLDKQNKQITFLHT